MARRRRRSEGRALCGVLVLDKPGGLTSHDVVQRARRLLNVHRIGHAGTLDPLASGVLVLMLGEATKLCPYLTGQDKSYLATVTLGVATDTLDADGQVTEVAALPPWCSDRAAAAEQLEQALAVERQRRSQTPPRHSAIKLGGQTAYRRARAGEDFELPERPCRVWQLDLVAHRPAAGALLPSAYAPPAGAAPPSVAVELSLRVSKGYYVRSLARDLGARLGLPAHLSQLRRTASGTFTLEQAHSLGADTTSAELEQKLISLTDAARQALPTATLTAAGAVRAACGQRLGAADFAALPAAGGPAAWLSPAGQLIAIGQLQQDTPEVLRGFRPAGGSGG